MSLERILALTDLSENSIPGLVLAERLAHRLHGRIVVGYVHTRTDVLRKFAKGKEDADRLAAWVREDDEEHLRALCERHVDALRLQGVETVDAASAREGVTEIVRRVEPELVCMATRGRTGVGHLLLGSVAEHTLRTAGVPVVVTKGNAFPGPEEPLRVMLALDLIEDPDALTREVARWLTGRDLLLLAHVVESWYYSPSAYGSEFALPQPDVPRLIGAATERLGAVQLEGDAPELAIEVATGRPGEGLLELERQCRPHLVVVRTHGRRGFDRMMLGSVSEFLARKAVHPVLVYPKTEGARSA